MLNKMILCFKENRIKKMEEFTLSLKDFTGLEHLELNLNSN